MNEQDDISKALEFFQLQDFCQENINLVDNMLNRGDGDKLLNAILSCESAAEVGGDSAVSRVMDTLEALANKSQRTACMLMVHLYSVQSYAHDVSDAIGLWLDACVSSEVTSYLQVLVRSERDISRRRTYQKLLAIRMHREQERGDGILNSKR